MTFGGVDTYYDYDERQWKIRRLGGGPVRKGRVCPAVKPSSAKPSSDERADKDSKHPRQIDPPGAAPIT